MPDALVFSSLLGAVYLAAGLADPWRVTPTWAKGSRWFVVVAALGLGGAGALADALTPAPEAAWEGETAALGQIDALVGLGRYADAMDVADSCLALPAATPAADTLRALRSAAEEQVLYIAARAIPASDAAANRDAYADLARRYPGTTLYAEKAAFYTRRAERPRRRATPSRRRISERPSSARGPVAARPPGCCRRCVTGVACGNGCIARGKTCTKPPGCAC